VEDLNAEIGEEENEDQEGEDDEDNFAHLKEEGNGTTEKFAPRSRNSQVQQKSLSQSSDEKENQGGDADQKKFSLNDEDDEGNKTIEIEDSKAGKTQEVITTYNYHMMDELMQFFEQEQIEPILCGYFNKIMQALINKAKSKVLQYLLLHRKGDIFNLLMKNLQHPSLAILMVELLQIKVSAS